MLGRNAVHFSEAEAPAIVLKGGECNGMKARVSSLVYDRDMEGICLSVCGADGKEIVAREGPYMLDSLRYEELCNVRNLLVGKGLSLGEKHEIAKENRIENRQSLAERRGGMRL